ncbi:MAG: TetR family transcriptional regulator [Pseudomonadota bacterium]
MSKGTDVDQSSVDPSTRNRAATEKRLIKAAISVFGDVGFQAATVAEISKEASANVALINRYFGGKQGLFDAVIDHIIVEKQTAPLPYPAGATLEDEVRNYLLFRYTEDKRNSRLHRLILSEAIVNDEFKMRALSLLTYAADTNFSARLETLIEDGKVSRDTNLRELFRMISLFSFSAGFVEGELLELPASETETLIAEFASTIAARFASAR